MQRASRLAVDEMNRFARLYFCLICTFFSAAGGARRLPGVAVVGVPEALRDRRGRGGDDDGAVHRRVRKAVEIARAGTYALGI